MFIFKHLFGNHYKAAEKTLHWKYFLTSHNKCSKMLYLEKQKMFEKCLLNVILKSCKSH